MGRKITSIVILIILTRSTSYCQNNEIISFDKVYSFINQIRTNDTVSFNLFENTSFGIFTDDTTLIFSDSIFNQSDVDFFRAQYALLDKEKWKESKIKGAKVISKRKLKYIFKKKNGWEYFRNKYGNCLTSFSLPVFNRSFEYCIFYHWTQCDYLAGGGSIDLFHFENGKWLLVKNYSLGES